MTVPGGNSLKDRPSPAVPPRASNQSLHLADVRCHQWLCSQGTMCCWGAVSRRQGHLGTHLGDTTCRLLSEQGQGTVLTCTGLCRCVSRTSSQAFFVPRAFTYSKSAAGAAYSLLWVKYEVITHILQWILFILILLICNMSSYSLSCTNHIHLGIIYSLLNDTSIAFNNII